MASVQNILFPMELSDLSAKIAPWAELMARRFDAEIHALHVIPDPGYWGVAYGINPSHLDDEPALIRKAEDKMEDFCRSQFNEDIKMTVRTVVGDPSEEILRYVDENPVSMVVLGTHGRRGLEKAVFGSVADRVVKASPVPVLSVHPNAKPE